MSLWTPDGERPVRRDPGPEPPPARAASAPAAGAPGAVGSPASGIDAENLSPEQQAEMEAMAKEMAEVRQQLASVPASVVVANHAMGLYELAAIHLSQQPPRLSEARLAIDAFAALLGAIQGRLGDDETALADALQQLRLAYVQVQGSAEGAPSPAE